MESDRVPAWSGEGTSVMRVAADAPNAGRGFAAKDVPLTLAA